MAENRDNYVSNSIRLIQFHIVRNLKYYLWGLYHFLYRPRKQLSHRPNSSQDKYWNNVVYNLVVGSFVDFIVLYFIHLPEFLARNSWKFIFQLCIMAACIYARKSWVQPFKNDWLTVASSGLALFLLHLNDHDLTIVICIALLTGSQKLYYTKSNTWFIREVIYAAVLLAIVGAVYVANLYDISVVIVLYAICTSIFTPYMYVL
ncbi:hypothetical protein TSAR_001031 [Trichomalopsis sarcophagae]|uniref:Uncharacterized protein n=1 Tax=Trichomalopsis sarcophagae TaxID=543379 RepID=A0A232FLW4_9HYME|nr:hypothetical protein TSAR_001031 [Trichomalopsis sarcophagae]